MCLGIPAQLVAGETGHQDLVMAAVGGVPRPVNIGLLEERLPALRRGRVAPWRAPRLRFFKAALGTKVRRELM